MRIAIIQANFVMKNQTELRYVQLIMKNALMNAKDSIHPEPNPHPSIDAPSLDQNAESRPRAVSAIPALSSSFRLKSAVSSEINHACLCGDIDQIGSAVQGHIRKKV